MDTTELLSVDAFIRHWAADRPGRSAMVGERRIDFAELDASTRRVATALQAAGLRKGDRIAWLGKNAVLYFTLLFGAARIGVVMAPVGWRLAAPERQFIVDDTQARLLFAGEGFADDARALAPQLPQVQRVLFADEAWAWIDATAPADFNPSGEGDAILQLYTSGTTGHPKGVELSNRNLFGLRRAAQEAKLPWAFWDDDEVVMVAMPCAHIGGTGLGFMALAGGVCGCVMAEFTPDGVFDAIEKEGVTRFFAVPAALQMLVNHPRCARTDFSRLRYIFYGAAPIPLELLRQCVRAFGCAFAQAYGMTETTGTVVMLPPEDHDPKGSPRMRAAGKPVPGVEVKIVDGAGQTLPAGEVGEIVTRSSNNMLGYWKQPEATQRTKSSDNWVHTGDAGYMDADGYVYIHDRVKDMIISGGENIYPAEVENAIYGHPDVADVAVIGVPDATWGEAVKAVCVPRPGHTLDAASVIAWARERIAGFKVPKSVDVVAELPRNPTGKILRRALRAPYWQGRERQVN
ncbi:MAG: Long-chain-fatty-acid--CoA ligase [Proteobacteria bacterium]|jgi:acyl-CoA synthetase (AMP-forming)/AMP-acid ligase II|nr:Long-chain-fatty-acid--CoA ligase [Pseudomonadota bacterium]